MVVIMKVGTVREQWFEYGQHLGSHQSVGVAQWLKSEWYSCKEEKLLRSWGKKPKPHIYFCSHSGKRGVADKGKTGGYDGRWKLREGRVNDGKLSASLEVWNRSVKLVELTVLERTGRSRKSSWRVTLHGLYMDRNAAKCPQKLK